MIEIRQIGYNVCTGECFSFAYEGLSGAQLGIILRFLSTARGKIMFIALIEDPLEARVSLQCFEPKVNLN